MRDRPSRFWSNTCDTSQHLKMPFCMSLMVVRFVANEHFSFLPLLLSLSPIKNYSLAILIVGISTSISIILISHFLSYPFCRTFLFCLILSSNLNLPNIVFFNLVLIFWISNFFFFSHFVKVLLVFNLIL